MSNLWGLLLPGPDGLPSLGPDGKCSRCKGYRQSDILHTNALQCLCERPIVKQPDPVPSECPASWDLVLADIKVRDDFGLKKYGVRHQPHNGRDTMQDLYEELLDAVVYLRAVLYERNGR